MEAYHVECMAQKARREVEAKAKEEAKRRRIVEKKKKKKKKLEYIQQLQDKMIVENATLLEGTEGSQGMGSEHKKVVSRNKEGY